MKTKLLLLLLLAVGSVGTVPSAFGFKQGDGITPSDRIHQRITATGLANTRAILPDFRRIIFSNDVVLEIEKWNAYADKGLADAIIEISSDGHFFDSQYHFDAEEFDKASDLVVSARTAIIDHVKSGRIKDAQKSLGLALHTIQDFYAHSNWVEKRAADAAYPHPDWGSTSPFRHSKFTGPVQPGDRSRSACDETALLDQAALTTGYYDLCMHPSIGNIYCRGEKKQRGADRGTWTNGWIVDNPSWPLDRCVHGGDGYSHGLNKDDSARGPLFEVAKKHAIEATSSYVQGIIDELLNLDQALFSAGSVCSLLGQALESCQFSTGKAQISEIKIVEAAAYDKVLFTVSVYGSNLTRWLTVSIDGDGYCEKPGEGSSTEFQVSCLPNPEGSRTITVFDATGTPLSTLAIEVGPEAGRISTLITNVGGNVKLWAEKLYSTVTRAVWSLTDYAADIVMAVVNGAAELLDVVFSSPGEKTATVLFKDESGKNVGTSTVTVNVLAISDVRPKTVIAGSTLTFEVIGANLPPGLAFGLTACGDTSEVLLGASSNLRMFTCRIRADASTGESIGTIGPGTHGDSPFGQVLHSFSVSVTPVSVTSVNAAPQPTVGGTSAVTVTGSNLPPSAIVLVDDATCDRATVNAKPDGTGFTQTCTFGSTAGTKTVIVMSASDSSGFIIDDTKTLTVGGSLGPTTALFDDFSGAAIDAAKWNIDGWEGTGNDYTGGLGRGIGPVTINNGLVEFGRLGRISTKNKVTFSGDNTIVIEGRTAATGALHDTSVMLVDTTSGDQILMGETNYAGWGFYAIGIGSYKLKEPSTIGDPTNPLTLGGITTEFMEYRLTITGDKIKIERGPTLANITQTGTGTLGRSIVGRTFHVSIGAAWAYYPATWDWIRVKADPGPPSAGLVGHWSFDNCDGRDSGPNALNGSVTGAPVCVDGRKGKALRFNGSSDWITVPTSAAMPSSAVTMSYWLHREGVAPRTPLENYISKELSFQAYMRPTSTTEFGVWLGTPGFWTGWGGPATVLPTANDWVHYAFTYDNASKRADTYVNGGLVHSVLETNANAVVRVSNQPMFIGRNGSANVYHIKGLLDDVRIYNRALTADEVRVLAR